MGYGDELVCKECEEYQRAGISTICPACEQDELDAYRRWKEEDIEEVSSSEKTSK